MVAGAPTSDEVAVTIRGFRDGAEVAVWQGVVGNSEAAVSFGRLFRGLDALQIEATKQDAGGATVIANLAMDNLVFTSNDIVW